MNNKAITVKEVPTFDKEIIQVKKEIDLLKEALEVRTEYLKDLTTLNNKYKGGKK